MRCALTALALLLLAARGGSGAGVPDQFSGTWGADCSSPYVRFTGDTVHVFPDNADYKINSATLSGNELRVAYETPSAALTDVYASEGAMLRLTGTISGGQQADWNKAPMSKCP